MNLNELNAHLYFTYKILKSQVLCDFSHIFPDNKKNKENKRG